MFSKLTSQLGQSLLEAIIAIGLFLTFFIGALALNSDYLHLYDRSNELNEVKTIAEETFNAVESIAYEDWDNIRDGTFGLTTSSGKWAFQTSSNKIYGKYKREVSVASIIRKDQQSCDPSGESGDFKDPETKFVTATIKWSSGSGTTTRSFGRYLSKWKDAKNYQVQDKNGVAFSYSGGIKTVDATSGTIKSWDTSNITVIGPMDADFDNNGLNDIVYLKNKNKIHVIDDNGGRSVSISNQKAKDEETILAAENWNGSGTSTFYVSDDVQGNYNEIYRVKPGTSSTIVAEPNNGASVVSGAGDIDNDGVREMVFVDQSQNLRYIEPDDRVSQTFAKIYSDVGVEINVNTGIGSVGDFDKDGTSTIPVVNSGNDLVLVGIGGVVETILNFNSGDDEEEDEVSNKPAKSPMASVDIDGDCLLEIVFIDVSGSSDVIKYIDDVGGSNSVHDLLNASGNKVEADIERGIINADTN